MCIPSPFSLRLAGLAALLMTPPFHPLTAAPALVGTGGPPPLPVSPDSSQRRFPLIRAFRRGSFDPYTWDGFSGDGEAEDALPPPPPPIPPRPLSARERTLYPILMAVALMPLFLIIFVVALAHTGLIAN